LSKKEPEKVTWRIVNQTLLVGQYKSDIQAQNSEKERKRAKIAAFDFVSYDSFIMYQDACGIALT
jgi:bifunctional polynucleotide phosphatase/kinase